MHQFPAFACGAVAAVNNRPGNSCTKSTTVSRRGALRLAALVIAGVVVPEVSATVRLGKPSTSDLLHQIERERSAEEIEAEKAARAEARRERLVKQNQLQRESERRHAEGLPSEDENQAEIEANLRANYYFPTARKRYLPRVKRASEDVPVVKAAIANGQWDEAGKFVNGGSLDDCVLPMKLYVSSLAGQGLSLATKFTQYMSENTEKVNRAVVNLKSAIKRHDTTVALAALGEMESAVSNWVLLPPPPPPPPPPYSFTRNISFVFVFLG